METSETQNQQEQKEQVNQTDTASSPKKKDKKKGRYDHLKSLLAKINKLKVEAIGIMKRLNYGDDVIRKTITSMTEKSLQSFNERVDQLKDWRSYSTDLQDIFQLVSDGAEYTTEIYWSLSGLLDSERRDALKTE